MAHENIRPQKQVYTAGGGGAVREPPRPSRYKMLRREEEKKRKKRRVLLLLLLLLLLIASGIALWYFVFGPGQAPPARDKPQDINRLVIGGDVQDGVFTEGMTAEEIEAALQAVADKDNFELKIAPEMIFKNGGSKGSVEIVNPKSNVYPMSVQVIMEDGTLIYESGLIKPEQFVSQGTLLKNLPAGVYKANGEVTIYSEDATKVEGMTAVEMEIIVQE